MTKESDLTEIFIGSIIEANFIKELLEDNGIGVLMKNTLKEGHLKKWASHLPQNSYMVLVAEEDELRANNIISEYRRSVENNTESDENDKD